MSTPDSLVSHDSSSLLSEDLLLCPICLDVFTDPVTTPCGHNFCNSCLTQCWGQSQHCQCPVCKEKFTKRPKLKINTTLREVADHFKKKRGSDKSEVLCDACSGEKMKALDDKLMETELKRIQQYAVDVTLDPDTAHPELILSADGKQVTHGDIQQNLPDTPQRFNRYIFVMGKQGFSSGRFYYEVQVRGKTNWDVGVVRENINRTGRIKLKPQNDYWTVVLRNGIRYEACLDPDVLLPHREMVEVVGVFVDYEEGLVSFYDVKSRSHIYSFTGQTFTEKLYPFLSPCQNGRGKNSAPLIISPVFKTECI
ncbi:zinc-binding protein A33-like [Tachysurus fulvidraco]|uniref:zinc-binding protein A33-like n=1 Tax=Tachysurus fulvidraco TaxID=1234273 RepID=UPI001FEE703A|nr:zinc-binding protein A33-like [Tachysurus fulvidraco]